ncbi:Transcriptional regulatory protein TdiR [Bremerella volcania]|uniref:Transcriptional regulatory protein TdiR n=1 Tax=Bremerella volcania TaxID=2527984 RepID=A0A518C964_9BACT|nr:LuxR C-terminal-related transcriptional regulator [Bremerella volcania]QDU75752.1 Transcriptional regulatory protein TdiR [Bremerella volcania]
MLTPSSHIALLESNVGQRKRLLDRLQDTSRHVHCLDSIDAFEQSLTVFDALVIDVNFEGGRGESLIQKLCQSTELTSILISATEAQLHRALVCLEAGAMSILEKPFELDRAKVVIDQAILGTRLRRKTYCERQRLGRRITTLTDRQREVFRHMVAGKHVKEIALEMGIGIKTVHTFRTQLFDKLEIDSPLQLIRDIAMVFGRRGLEKLSASADDQTIAQLMHQIKKPMYVDLPVS